VREFTRLPSNCWATSLGLLFRLRHSQLTVLLLGVSGPKSEARSISLSGRTTGRTRPVPSAPLDGGLSPASLPLAEPMLRAVEPPPQLQPICLPMARVLAPGGGSPSVHRSGCVRRPVSFADRINHSRLVLRWLHLNRPAGRSVCQMRLQLHCLRRRQR